MIYENDPFPDIKDPISGEWLPASYSDIKRMRQEAKRIASDESGNKMMLNLLKSIMK